MNLRDIPRGAFKGYLSVLRFPIDTALKLAGRPRSGPVARAGVAADRVDATVRGTVGRAAGDFELQNEAARRSVAADDREKAADLEEAAERRRTEAAARSKQRSKQAAERKQTTTRAAKQTESRRKAANAKATEAVEDVIDDQARRARLEALDEKAQALGSKDKALTAKQEADRLRKSAERIKANR